MDYLDRIVAADVDFIYWVNGFHSAELDILMAFLSNKYSAVPLYLLLLFLFYKKYGFKSFILLAPIIGLLIGLADQGASGFAKPYFERLRPCHALNLYLADGCGGKFGFFSSHASNSFAVATLFSIVVLKGEKKRWISLISWALIVSFSRIYLGAHYLTDVLVGGVFGTFCGVFCAWLFLKTNSRFIKS